MEVFRQIEEHFAKIDTNLTVMAAKVDGVHKEMQSLRGCFASIEAMLIANAAQMADVLRRIEALEKKQDAA